MLFWGRVHPDANVWALQAAACESRDMAVSIIAGILFVVSLN